MGAWKSHNGSKTGIPKCFSRYKSVSCIKQKLLVRYLIQLQLIVSGAIGKCFGSNVSFTVYSLYNKNKINYGYHLWGNTTVLIHI